MSLKTEIFEQPAVASRLISAKWPEIQDLATRLRNHTIRYIFLAARGTSDNAGRYAKYLFGAHNQVPVALAAPSLFSLYSHPPRLDDCLVIAISQSGQSPDIVSVLEEAGRQGTPSIAITNDASSPLSGAAQFTLELSAGQELSVAATKTYTAELLTIALLSTAISGEADLFQQIQNIPRWMEEVLDQQVQIQAAAQDFVEMSHCVVISRGYNYATAFEWSLKLKELSYIIAEPYSSADFMHGPVALLEGNFPVFLVAPNGETFAQLYGLAKDVLLPRHVNLLSITNRTEMKELPGTHFLIAPKIPEWLSPIVSILPAQMFCTALAGAKGLDLEHPRGLSKITLTH